MDINTKRFQDLKENATFESIIRNLQEMLEHTDETEDDNVFVMYLQSIARAYTLDKAVSVIPDPVAPTSYLEAIDLLAESLYTSVHLRQRLTLLRAMKVIVETTITHDKFKNILGKTQPEVKLDLIFVTGPSERILDEDMEVYDALLDTLKTLKDLGIPYNDIKKVVTPS